MTDNDGVEREASGERKSGAAQRAHQAIDAAREFVAGTDVNALRAKAADAASSLYRDGRELISSNSPDMGKAGEDLRDSIRKNPLAAIGIAFTAGLLVALLTRG